MKEAHLLICSKNKFCNLGPNQTRRTLPIDQVHSLRSSCSQKGRGVFSFMDYSSMVTLYQEIVFQNCYWKFRFTKVPRWWSFQEDTVGSNGAGWLRLSCAFYKHYCCLDRCQLMSRSNHRHCVCDSKLCIKREALSVCDGDVCVAAQYQPGWQQHLGTMRSLVRITKGVPISASIRGYHSEHSGWMTKFILFRINTKYSGFHFFSVVTLTNELHQTYQRHFSHGPQLLTVPVRSTREKSKPQTGCALPLLYNNCFISP